MTGTEIETGRIDMGIDPHHAQGLGLSTDPSRGHDLVHARKGRLCDFKYIFSA